MTEKKNKKPKVNHLSRTKIKDKIRYMERDGMQNSNYYLHLQNRLKETAKNVE